MHAKQLRQGTLAMLVLIAALAGTNLGAQDGQPMGSITNTETG